MKLHGWKIAGKSWTAFLGSLLTLLIPLLLQFSPMFPPPWPAVIGAVIAVLTAVGVYHAPYTPVNNRAAGSVTPLNPPTVGGPSSGSPWPTN